MTNCQETYLYDASSTLIGASSTCEDITSSSTAILPTFTYGEIVISFFIFLLFAFVLFKTAFDFVNPSKNFQKYD